MQLFAGTFVSAPVPQHSPLLCYAHEWLNIHAPDIDGKMPYICMVSTRFISQFILCCQWNNKRKHLYCTVNLKDPWISGWEVKLCGLRSLHIKMMAAVKRKVVYYTQLAWHLICFFGKDYLKTLSSKSAKAVIAEYFTQLQNTRIKVK